MNAVEACKLILTQNPLFLDCESTGIRLDDQIVDLAIVDVDGNVVLDTLVRPTVRIPKEATKVHGITDDMVKDAPTFAELHPRLRELCQGRVLVFYNADFDRRMLRQSARAHGLAGTGPDVEWWCAMVLYAEHRGEWDDYHGHARWYKLEKAARQCGLEVAGKLHRALADAELTRRLVVWMAGQDIPPEAAQ